MKKCIVCNLEKAIEEFLVDKRTGNLRGKCTVCFKKWHKEYNERNKIQIAIKTSEKYKLLKDSPEVKIARKKRYDENKERIKAEVREYRIKNRSAILERNKKRRLDNLENYRLKNKIYRDKNLLKLKEYRESRREKTKIAQRKWAAKKRASDSFYRLKKSLSGRCLVLFKKISKEKPTNTESLLGISYPLFKIHIERQFKKGMTWKNYGHDTWHIDHIIPLASAKNEEEMIALCHYTNLRPLWALDNHKKGAKIIETQTTLTI